VLRAAAEVIGGCVSASELAGRLGSDPRTVAAIFAVG